MKKTKLKLFSLALIIIVLMLVWQVRIIDTSFSYATNGTATSVVTSGTIDLNVYEVTPLQKDLTIFPGAQFPWCVEAKNDGDHPFYLRIKLAITIPNMETVSQDSLLPQLDETMWEYHDGWYYYKTAVPANHAPITLFSGVTVNGAVVDNSYINQQIEATVVAHAVQSDNNPLIDDQTFTASGWPRE